MADAGCDTTAVGESQHCGHAEASSSRAPMAQTAAESKSDAGNTAISASADAVVPQPAKPIGGAPAASAGPPAESEPATASQPPVADQHADATPEDPPQEPSMCTAAAVDPKQPVQPVQGPPPAPAASPPARQRAAAAAAPHQPIGNVVIQTDEDAIRELRARQAGGGSPQAVAAARALGGRLMDWRPHAALAANLTSSLPAGLTQNLQGLHPEAVRSGLQSGLQSFVDGSALRRGFGAMPMFGRGAAASPPAARHAESPDRQAPGSIQEVAAGACGNPWQMVRVKLAVDGSGSAVTLQLRLQAEPGPADTAQRLSQQPARPAAAGAQPDGSTIRQASGSAAAASTASGLPGMLGGIFGRQRSGESAAPAPTDAAARAQAARQATQLDRQQQPTAEQPHGGKEARPQAPGAAAQATSAAQAETPATSAPSAATAAPSAATPAAAPPNPASPSAGGSWLGLFRSQSSGSAAEHSKAPPVSRAAASDVTAGQTEQAVEAAPQTADPLQQSAGQQPERRASEGSAAAQSQAVAAEPPTAEERRALAVATEMASRLRDAIAAVLQEAFSAPQGGPAGAQPVPLGDDSAAVVRLCDLMSVFLHHGLVSSPPGGGWGARVLAGGGASPVAVLEAASAAAAPAHAGGSEDAAQDLGLSAVRGERSRLDEGARLRAWLRASLNQQALGARLLALYRQQPLLAQWYTRGAALRIEDIAAIVLGLLPALDGVPFALSIDPATADTPAAAKLAQTAGSTQQHPPQTAQQQGQLSGTGAASTAAAGPAADDPATTAPAAVAAAAGAPAMHEANAGFLASFGGLLSRRSAAAQPAMAAALPVKGNRRVVAIGEGDASSPDSPAAPRTAASAAATPAGSGLLSPVSSMDMGAEMAGMSGAEPLSPATLAYFTQAAVLQRGHPPGTVATSPSQQASPHTNSNECATDASGQCRKGDKSLPAAELLSPFQSDAPSPLELLQALQAEAGPSDADADLGDVAPGDLEFLAKLLKQPGTAPLALQRRTLQQQEPGQLSAQQHAPHASSDAVLSPMRSVSSLYSAAAADGDFARLLETSSTPSRRVLGRQRSAVNSTAQAAVQPHGPVTPGGAAEADVRQQRAVDAGTPSMGTTILRVQLQVDATTGHVHLQLRLPAGSDSVAAAAAAPSATRPGAEGSEPVGLADMTAPGGGDAADTALWQGRVALVAAKATVAPANTTSTSVAGEAADTARSDSLSSLSDVADAAAAALHTILRTGRSDNMSTNSGSSGSSRCSDADSVSGSSAASSTMTQSSSGGLSAGSDLDLGLPEAPTHRVSPPTTFASAAPARGAATDSGDLKRSFSKPDSYRARAAAQPQPEAVDMPYSDITAMLAASAGLPRRKVEPERSQLSGAAGMGGVEAAPAASQPGNAAAGSQAAEAAHVRQYLQDNGINLSDDEGGPAAELPDVPGAARLRDAQRDLSVNMLTAAALDAAGGGAARDAFSGDGGLLEDMSQVLMGFDTGSGAHNPDASSEASGSAWDVGSPASSVPAAALGALGAARSADGAAAPAFEVTSVRIVGAETAGEGRKQFTLYRLAVEAEGGASWEVARRFSDFQALRVALAAAAPAGLPLSWGHLGRARSVTGASRLSPEVVTARAALLDRCLADLLAAPPAASAQPPRAAPAFLAFLQPRQLGGGDALGKSAWKSPLDWMKQRASGSSPSGSDGAFTAEAAAAAAADATPLPGYGGSLRLLTDPPTPRSAAETLLMQGGACASCRAPLPPAGAGGSLIGGSSKGPRLCEYTGGLFCRRCHSGKTARLPARALHSWDFMPRPVCDNAAEFLAATYRQPLLAVSAVAPGLYARVPTLARAHELRLKAARSLAAARGAGPATAAKVERLLAAAGPKRHLLEGADFWALSELADLAGGAFARMPPWLEAAAAKAADLAATALLEMPQPSGGGSH